MNEKKTFNNLNFNLAEIFLDFDYKKKLCDKSHALLKIFDFLSLQDMINWKNTNHFFFTKFNIDFYKKILKNKFLKRNEHAYLLRKIIINEE